MTLLIGLVGLIGSGKGTAGSILQEKGFVSDSFAKPVKDALSCIFGWSRELLEGDTVGSREWRETPDPWWSEKLGFSVTPRKAMTMFGTEACRNNIHSDIWIRSLEKRITNKNIVITDARFTNELDFIKSKNGFIVEIKRGHDPDWFELASLPDAEIHMKYAYPEIHSSEWSWVSYKKDFSIRNDDSVEELRNNIDALLNALHF